MACNPAVLKKKAFEGNFYPSGISVYQHKAAAVGKDTNFLETSPSTHWLLPVE